MAFIPAMNTTADWTQTNGQFVHFNFQFQCTPGYQNDVAGANGSGSQKRLTVKVPPGWPTKLVIHQ